jgi:hypothetical protein
MTTRELRGRLPDLPHYNESGLGWQKHSEASKDGARAALPKKPTQESRCLEFISERGRAGATSDEVADATGIELYIIRARLAGLHKKGSIFGDGRRDGAHGVAVTIWKHIDYRPPAGPDGQGDLFGQAA